ncbi:MAG: hypothetical protein WD048_11885 [Chitinophagales bacterium]
MIDASSFIFNITNNEWFPASQQREVMYLQQIFPVLMAKAGAGLKQVMISYVINVYLLYYLIFIVIIALLKDPFSALLYLFVQISGSPYSYFLIAAEILPGSAIIILLISTLYNLEYTNKRYVNYLFSLIILFFTIRSHPLITICLIAILALMYVSKKELFVAHKNFFITFSIIGTAFILYKLFFINHYELNYIKTSFLTIKFLLHNNWILLVIFMAIAALLGYLYYKFKPIVYITPYFLIALAIILVAYIGGAWILSDSSFNKLIAEGKHEFINLVVYLFHGRLFFTLSIFVTVIYLTVNKQLKILLVYSTSLFIYSILLYSVMDFKGMEIKPVYTLLSNNYSTIAHDTWGMPLRIIAFSGLLLIILPAYKLSKAIKFLTPVALISMILNFIIIDNIRAISDAYIEQANTIIDSCRANEISKAIISRSQLDEDIPVLDHVYQDILVLSSLRYDSSIHVIYAPDDSIRKYMKIPEDYLILEQSADTTGIDELNTKYYKIKESEYIYLDIE